MKEIHSNNLTTRWMEFRKGVRDTLPLVIGVTPFGIILGDHPYWLVRQESDGHDRWRDGRLCIMAMGIIEAYLTRIPLLKISKAVLRVSFR